MQQMLTNANRSKSLEICKNLYIQEKELNFEQRLGQGTFGTVWKCSYKDTVVAYKKVTNSVEEEAAILNSLRHKNIINHIGIVHDPPNFGLILEFASGGSLQELIHKKSIEIHDEKRNHWIGDIVDGMIYLHYNAPITILHRDLKPANVLLTNTKLEHLDNLNTAKLADFGSAKIFEQFDSMSASLKGSVPYMAPEIIRQARISRPADVYSFGVLLWELLTRTKPYEGFNHYQAIMKIGSYHELSLNQLIDPKFAKLIKATWKRRPEDRPNFKDISLVIDPEKPVLGDKVNSTFNLVTHMESDISPNLSLPRNICWLTYPPSCIVLSQWNPNQRHIIAVSKSQKVVTLLNTEFVYQSGNRELSLGKDVTLTTKVTCFNWNPQGSCIAIGTTNGRIWLCSDFGEHIYRVIVCEGFPINKIKWNADGTLIGAICKNSTVLYVIDALNFMVYKCYDLKRGKHVLEWCIAQPDVLACVSDIATVLYKYETNSVSLILHQSPEKTQEISKEKKSFPLVKWSKSGQYIALAGECVLTINELFLGRDYQMNIKRLMKYEYGDHIKDIDWTVFRNINYLGFVDGGVKIFNSKLEETYTILPKAHFQKFEYVVFNSTGTLLATFESNYCLLLIVDVDSRDIKAKLSLNQGSECIASRPTWNSYGNLLAVHVTNTDCKDVTSKAILLISLVSKSNLSCIVMAYYQSAYESITEINEAGL